MNSNLKGLFSLIIITVFALGQYPLNAQTNDAAKAFLDYVHNPSSSILPDFSYVGYHNGEVAVPENRQLKVFNVTDYGAKPNDEVSDKNAIRKAIKAAENNGGGVVFFPKGKFLVNEDDDDKDQIVISGSNIIFRGSGSGEGGTEIFMKNMLAPRDSTKMWSVPTLFITKSNTKNLSIGRLTGNVSIGSNSIYLQKPADLKVGDWIELRMKDNNPAMIKKEMGIHEADPTWTSLVKDGVNVRMNFQIKDVSNNHLLLNAPIPFEIDSRSVWSVYKIGFLEELGLEHLAFVGNWKDKFVHHRSWKDDSGFSLWHVNNVVNGWVVDCRFSDANACFTIGDYCANITVLNCTLTGNPGHEAISNTGGTNVLLANITDVCGEWHSVGVARTSMNTVIYKATYPSNTSFETHASQPRNTLLDCVIGGLQKNHGGGAQENLPNHMSNLIFWNYKQTNTPYTPFDFWPIERYWKVAMPIVIGYTGGTTFIHEQLKYEESTGKAVLPTSLYEAQLKLRLGKKSWMGE